jgi:putative transposase
MASIRGTSLRQVQRRTRAGDRCEASDAVGRDYYKHGARSRVVGLLLDMMARLKRTRRDGDCVVRGHEAAWADEPLLGTSDGVSGTGHRQGDRTRAGRQRYLAPRMHYLAAIWSGIDMRTPAAFRRRTGRPCASLLPGSSRMAASTAAPSPASWTTSNPGIAHLRLPVTHKPNHLDLPKAFGEHAIPKVVFGALIRAAERWRSRPPTSSIRR